MGCGLGLKVLNVTLPLLLSICKEGPHTLGVAVKRLGICITDNVGWSEILHVALTLLVAVGKEGSRLPWLLYVISTLICRYSRRLGWAWHTLQDCHRR